MDPLDQFESVTREGAAYTRGLIKVWEKLGKPEDCSNNTGWVMLDNIIQVWIKAWPQEARDWVEQLKYDLGVERTVREAMKANGGYFPVSYPTRLYKMIKALLPAQKLNDKKFMRQLISRYPFLKSTNLKI
jgi:hypothetical protein